MLFCDTCSVQVPSETVMQAHVQGKKHQRLVQQYQQQSLQAAKSIYVRGLWRQVGESDIQQHFMQFGQVAKVFLEKDKGLYSIVEYANDKGPTAALACGSHVLRGRHLVVKAKEVKVYAPRKKQPVESRAGGAAETQAPTLQTVDHQALLQKLRSCHSVSEQMLSLSRELELNPEDRQLRHMTATTLKHLFNKHLPDCEVVQFGSSANGLGVLGCDLDLFLDLKLHSDEVIHQPEASEEGAGVSSSSDQASLMGALSFSPGLKSWKPNKGAISKEMLEAATIEDRIRAVARILFSACKIGIRDVLMIPKARRPLIKCLHQPTGLKCDITINNRIALKNTELVQFYLALDPRVRCLVFAVRYWAKQREIAGNVNTGPRLTNYALTMLVFFYLQSTEPPILPTVQQLADLADSSDSLTVDGWDCSFTSNSSRVPRSSNQDDLSTLLTGFFDFYTAFNLAEMVICPRTGRKHRVIDFRKQVECEEDNVKGFKIAPLCVQDPFVLEHNTTSNISDKVKQQILHELHSAAAKCHHPRMSKVNQSSRGTGSADTTTPPPVSPEDNCSPSAAQEATQCVEKISAGKVAEDKSKQKPQIAEMEKTTEMQLSKASVVSAPHGDSVPKTVNMSSGVKAEAHKGNEVLNTDTGDMPLDWGLVFLFSAEDVRPPPHRMLPGQEDQTDVTNAQRLDYSIRLPMDTSKLGRRFLAQNDDTDTVERLWYQAVVEFVKRVIDQVFHFTCELHTTRDSSAAGSMSTEKCRCDGKLPCSSIIEARKQPEDDTTGTKNPDAVEIQNGDPDLLLKETSRSSIHTKMQVADLEIVKGGCEALGDVAVDDPNIEMNMSDMKLGGNGKGCAKLNKKRGSSDNEEILERDFKRQKCDDAMKNVQDDGDIEKRCSSGNADLVPSEQVETGMCSEMGGGNKVVSGQTSVRTEEKKEFKMSAAESTCGSTISMTCSSKHRLWMGRKRMKKEVHVTEPADLLAIEAEISRLLLSIPAVSVDKVVVGFTLTMTHIDGGAALVTLKPTLGVKEFSCFFAFFKAFLTKLVDRCLPVYARI